MMNFLGKAGNRYIESKAEERFQQAAIVLTSLVTVEQWEAIAKNGTDIKPLLSDIPSPDIDESDHMIKIGLNHLNSLTTEQFTTLVEEVAPEHGTFLENHPEFARSLCSEIKGMILG